jgi:hypothetical protein
MSSLAKVPKMGMDRFSIVEIVKDNPKEKNKPLRRYQRSGHSTTLHGQPMTQWTRTALRLRICVSKASFRRIAHSLDTRSGSASITDVDVVFYRGITMQRAVERDSENRSNYAMCAVNSSRVSPTFSDVTFCEVVDSIAIHTASCLRLLVIMLR